MDNRPKKDVKVIVVKNSLRIPGFGDLSCKGMGTHSDQLLDDILYLGYPHKRLKGTVYDERVDEF